MTREEFNNILLAAKKFQWQLQGTGETIRAKLLGRNISKDDAIIEWWTPITAVCYTHKQIAFHPAEEREAAQVLGLSSTIAREIMHESDFPLSKRGAHVTTV